MATAFAAAATAPALPACCMRMSHACHGQQNPPGDKFESVCRNCGWCHAVPNARAHLTFVSSTFSFSVYHAAQIAGPDSHPTLAASRLHASRAPPRSSFATEQS